MFEFDYSSHAPTTLEAFTSGLHAARKIDLAKLVYLVPGTRYPDSYFLSAGTFEAQKKVESLADWRRKGFADLAKME